MRKFIASLLLVGVLGFVGCGEKTDKEKAKDAVEDATEEVKKDIKKLAE
ncbi:MAG: hypothetical protein NE328_01480 [Lentisphaeraceae bacterium]|nr:hypothetical protein [Lentisphaeraceae bacterium]